MANKNKGKVGIRKGSILLDEVDLNVLRKLTESKKELAIGDVQYLLRMSHVSFKIHVRRLIELGFITKARVPKTFRFILKLTEEGKEVLKIFEKALKK
jgi:DNA-binding MarR family transcriptional regulator